jgi:uncharacterized OsmC-like protein
MSQATVKAALMTAMSGIQESPDAARAEFHVYTELEEDMRCRAKVREFPPIVVDETPALGGSDANANPVELVLVALGTCQEIMYRAYASVMDVPLTSVKVRVRGDLDLRGLFGMDPGTPPGFEKIVYETELDSPADDEILRNLVQTVESHCPVLDTLTRPVDVSGSVTINGHPIATEALAA